MASFKDRLKEILIRDEILTAKELDKALTEQKKSGGELSKILVDMNFVSQDQLTQVLSESLELPLIKIDSFCISQDVIQSIPKDIALKYQIIPVSLLGDQLTLAMADPLNIFIIDNVKALTGHTIIPIICRVSDIKDAIKKYYFKDGDEKPAETQEPEEKNNETFDEIIQDFRDTEDLELIKDTHSDNQSSVEEISDEAPIIKLTDTIIQQAVLAKASDVFIEPLEKAVRIRYRIDGVIREIDRMTKVLHFPLVSRIKVISNLDISEHRLPQDGRFKTIISGDREVDFRVNVLPTAVGEKVVLRVLDQQGTVLDVENLGFEATALQRLKECSVRPHGLILTCGPTGSGKTTTLYSILKYVDSPEKNIVTVEDPVEYQMKGINQVNVKAKMGLTFATSLRSILRQDPDIIMIGEIRDKETLDIAVKAALTGHLVLSSLHTTTAAGSIVRMMNMGIEPFLICSSVLVIIAQRLLRRVCPKCCEPYTVTPEVAAKIGIDKLYPKQKVEVMRPKGCAHCFKTGYKGRVGITEILVFNQKVKEGVLARVGEIKIKKIARKEGMRTMREDGLVKVVEGLTTIEEVLRLTAPDEVQE